MSLCGVCNVEINNSDEVKCAGVCGAVFHATCIKNERDGVSTRSLKNRKCKDCRLLSTSSEVRAKKPSLTLNLGTNGLKVTSEPPPMAGQAGRLQGQDRSAVTCPSSSHARRCLIWLSCDNRRTLLR
ncbi:hypothetical protein J6590_096101 [Homalodisca vitripennis]|nr:hypothetical protein J6590_096101 [Homalodisca vitripennis]